MCVFAARKKRIAQQPHSQDAGPTAERWSNMSELRTPRPATQEPVELRIYRVPLSAEQVQLVTCMRHLSPEEQQRASGFRTELEHRRYVITRARLREVVGQVLDMAPRAVPFVYSASGKPSLDPAVQDGVHFNCSHAGDLGLIALASVPVGIAVMPIRQLENVMALAGDAFSIHEQAQLRRATNPDALSLLFQRGCVHKAAVAKAIDARPAADSFSVALDRLQQHLHLPDLRNADQPALVAADYEQAQLLTLLHLEPAPNYVGAVAACARSVSLRWQSVAPRQPR